MSATYANREPDDDEQPDIDDSIGGQIQINLADRDLPSWEHDLQADIAIINALLAEMHKMTPEDDAKLQHLYSSVI